MGYFFMPVRRERDAVVNHFVCWSTNVDNFVARGTRSELEVWWRAMFGTEGMRTLEIETPFVRADVYGSSSHEGRGRWGTTLDVSGYGLLGPAQLDRDKLPEFAEAAWPHPHADATRDAVAVGRAVRALVTPMDPAEDPDIEPGAWQRQAEQAIAEYEGRSTGDRA